MRAPVAQANEAATENLKVIKVLHQLLMAVTAAIFAFAARPDLAPEYKNALGELAALRQVSWGEWSNFVANRYSEPLVKDKKLLSEWVHQGGLRVRKDAVGPTIPVFGDQVPVPSNARLLDLETFFSKTQRIGVMVIGSSERQHFLEQAATWKTTHPNSTITMLNLSVNSGVQYNNGSLMLDWLNRSPAAVSSFPLYLNTDDQPQQPTYIIITYSIQSENGSFALDWLRNDTFGRRVVDAKTGMLFPHTKVFWHEINQNTPDQAVVILQEEMSAVSRGTLSFFGISIERSLAVVAGPVAIFCILLFMGLHLAHFRSLLPPNEALRNYPWVALFSSRFAALVAYISLSALPLAACGYLLYKFGNQSEQSTRIGDTFMVLALVAVAWVASQVNQVRKRARLLGD